MQVTVPPIILDDATEYKVSYCTAADSAGPVHQMGHGDTEHRVLSVVHMVLFMGCTRPLRRPTGCSPDK